MNVTYNNKTVRNMHWYWIEINEVDHYTWIFASKIFRLAVETTFLKKYFFLQMAYVLLLQSRELNFASEIPKEQGGFEKYFANCNTVNKCRPTNRWGNEKHILFLED